MSRSKEIIIRDRMRRETGARPLSDVKQQDCPKTRPGLPELDSVTIEMRRAGFSETQIKTERRLEAILALGRENIIEPCRGCPESNAELLCNKREDIRLRESGNASCDRGVLTVVSAAK